MLSFLRSPDIWPRFDVPFRLFLYTENAGTLKSISALGPWVWQVDSVPHAYISGLGRADRDPVLKSNQSLNLWGAN